MNKSEKFWDRSANSYDKEEMKDKEIRINILEKVKKHLKKTDDVLDFGCATGILANEIAADVHTVYGIDISPQMIQVAQDKAHEQQILNVTYNRSTIFEKKGTFDVILGIYMLHLLEDIPAALQKIHELLKPGGLFISVTPCLGKKSFTGMALLLAGKIGLIPGLQLFSLADLEGRIMEAGFQVLTSERFKEKGQQYFIVAEKRQEEN